MADDDGIRVSNRVFIPMHEIQWHAVRAQGAGGQNVNKVASAVHLRFDVRASSLPEWHQQRVLALRDARLTEAGEIVIKAQSHRTQTANLDDALQRLAELIRGAIKVQKARKPSRPSLSSKRRGIEKKKRKAATKANRRKPVL